MQALHRLTATEILAKLSADSLTVEEYATSLLERVRERDQVVGAWAFLDRDVVLREARRLDKVPPNKRGPLHGVAVGLKDVIYTKGLPGLPNPALSDSPPVLILVRLRAWFRHADMSQLAHTQGLAPGTGRCRMRGRPPARRGSYFWQDHHDRIRSYA